MSWGFGQSVEKHFERGTSRTYNFLFRASCESGLSVVRPLTGEARKRDEFGWNFGEGWPPSYEAFGRMRFLSALRQALSLRPRRVLELAAGDAALCACLASEGIAVVANDLRAEKLRAAVANFENEERIELIPGNLFELDPSHTGRFDLVIACEVIEHLAHADDFLRHVKRFLEPGGRILLTTPNGAYFRNRLPTLSEIENYSSLESRQFQPDAEGHLFLITPAELSELATHAGLRVEKIELYATPFITGHCRLSLMRGKRMISLCYSLEMLSRRLPIRLREKVCFSLSVLLSN